MSKDCSSKLNAALIFSQLFAETMNFNHCGHNLQANIVKNIGECKQSCVNSRQLDQIKTLRTTVCLFSVI